MQRHAKAFFTAAALVLAFGTGMANASEYKFRYNKHELDSNYGVEQLYKRIVARAKSACISPGYRGLWRIEAEKKCVSAVTNEIVLRIDHPRLAVMHAEVKRFAAKG